MSVTRELLRIVGGKKERVNIGALAQNVKEDENHRFVTDEEKESWNEKLSKDGDVAESTVSILEETLEAFPKPKAGEKQKTLWGKIVKWQQDCLTKFGNYVLMSMLTNQHLNSTNNIPTSALVYLMQQAIQQNQSDINVLNTNLGIRYENVHITKELNNATLTSMSSKRLGPGLYIINSSIRIEAKLSCTLLHMLYVNGMADDIGSVALTLPPGQQYLNHTCIISISEENTNLELRARQDGNSVVTGTSWMIITRIK